MIINLQRNLHPPNMVSGEEIQPYIDYAEREMTSEHRQRRCTTYTVSHYGFSVQNRGIYDSVPIDYPIIDCGFGVDVGRFPKGYDRGPFTDAVLHASANGHDGAILSNLDLYIRTVGIDRDLVEDYVDSDFVGRLRERPLETRIYKLISMNEVAKGWIE